MDNLLGNGIGVVGHAFSITNDAGDKVQLSVKIDFTGASDADIKAWLVSNRIIAGQRPWRSLSKDELVKMNGMTFQAETIGQKVKSTKELTTAVLNQYANMSVEQITEDLMKTPGMVIEKAQLLAEAMAM